MVHSMKALWNIFRQSSIMLLLSSEMTVMVDTGFLVDALVPGKVCEPAFLKESECQHMMFLRSSPLLV